MLLIIVAIIWELGDYVVRRQTEPIAYQKYSHAWSEIGTYHSFVQMVDCRTAGKIPYALFYGCVFSSPADYASVRSYYVDRLTSLGWTKTKETNNKLWGVDRGGRSIFFCNSEYQFRLDYSNGNDDWDYAVTLEEGCDSK